MERTNDAILVFWLEPGRIVRSVDSQTSFRSGKSGLQKLEVTQTLRCGRDLYKVILFTLMTIIQF